MLCAPSSTPTGNPTPRQPRPVAPPWLAGIPLTPWPIASARRTAANCRPISKTSKPVREPVTGWGNQTMNQPNSRPSSELMLRETASQTAGPYVHIGLALAAAGNPTRDEEIWNEMARDGAEGEQIEVVGTVIDGNGDLVRDAFIEAWQADAKGEYQRDRKSVV